MKLAPSTECTEVFFLPVSEMFDADQINAIGCYIMLAGAPKVAVFSLREPENGAVDETISGLQEFLSAHNIDVAIVPHVAETWDEIERKDMAKAIHSMEGFDTGEDIALVWVVPMKYATIFKRILGFQVFPPCVFYEATDFPQPFAHFLARIETKRVFLTVEIGLN